MRSVPGLGEGHGDEPPVLRRSRACTAHSLEANASLSPAGSMRLRRRDARACMALRQQELQYAAEPHSCNSMHTAAAAPHRNRCVQQHAHPKPPVNTLPRGSRPGCETSVSEDPFSEETCHSTRARGKPRTCKLKAQEVAPRLVKRGPQDALRDTHGLHARNGSVMHELGLACLRGGAARRVVRKRTRCALRSAGRPGLLACEGGLVLRVPRCALRSLQSTPSAVVWLQ